MSHSKHVHIKRSDIIEVSPMTQLKETALITGQNLIAFVAIGTFILSVTVWAYGLI